MLLNYYKIALRHFRSIYSIINLSGLAIGLTVFILTFLWIDDELSYDRFHPDHNRIFRVVQNQTDGKGSYHVALTPALLLDYLKGNFAEIENGCRLVSLEVLVRYDEQAFNRTGLAADPSFFSIFSYPLLSGSFEPFFTGIDKIILSEKMASTYFGKENPLGKSVKIASRDFEVVAVIKVPENSHLHFDFVVPIEVLKALGWETLDQWDWNRFHTYIKAKPEVSATTLDPKIKGVIKKNNKEATGDLYLQPLNDIHLRSAHLNNDMAGHHNIQYIYVFGSAAIFVLIIACINYTNLATARSIKRAKEVGIRSVSGANRNQLMMQYFSESLLNCFLALCLAVLASWLVLPWFNELCGKTLDLSILSFRTLWGLALATIFCGILTGVYPAVYLSSLNPSKVLRGMMKVGVQGIYFRRTLVTIQLTLSIVLVLATLIVDHQLTYLHEKNIGYNKENIIVFHIIRKVKARYNDLKQELKTLNGVVDVTVANSSLALTDENTDLVVWEGMDPNKKLLFHVLMVDHDFVKTFAMKIIEGRDFSPLMATDSSGYLLNEEAVRQMNLAKPVGAALSVNERPGTIIGVVADFNFKSAHKKIEPMILYIDPDSYSEVAVRLKMGDVAQNIKAIEKVFKKFSPDRPFEYEFLDKSIDKLYQSEQQINKIFTWFAALAFFISALGLLSILMFTTELRKKEMAIRKVMGASIGRVFLLFSKEFIVLITLGNIIAMPIAIYLMNQWLGEFAYFEKTPVSLFVITAFCSITLTWLLISFSCLKASRSNPVNNLRSE